MAVAGRVCHPHVFTDFCPNHQILHIHTAKKEGCPHGDNALRFIDFALSEDVQRYLMDHCSRRSVRADLRREEGDRFLDFNSFDYDAVWAGEQREALLAQWRVLWGEEGGAA